MSAQQLPMEGEYPDPVRILITGSRYWNSNFRPRIRKALQELPPNSVIIVGDNGDYNPTTGVAKGVDTIARLVALSLGLTVIKGDADWKKHGKAAGPIRNDWMLDQHPDEVWFFHDRIEESKGTKDCVAKARRRGIPTIPK